MRRLRARCKNAIAASAAAASGIHGNEPGDRSETRFGHLFKGYRLRSPFQRPNRCGAATVPLLDFKFKLVALSESHHGETVRRGIKLRSGRLGVSTAFDPVRVRPRLTVRRPSPCPSRSRRVTRPGRPFRSSGVQVQTSAIRIRALAAPPPVLASGCGLPRAPSESLTRASVIHWSRPPQALRRRRRFSAPSPVLEPDSDDSDTRISN